MNRLRRIAWALAAGAYGPLHDLRHLMGHALRVRRHRGLPPEGREALMRLRGASRLAFVVIHPRFVEFSIRNLVVALAGAGFSVAALTSEEPPPALVQMIEDFGGTVVRRHRIGRDVGGYADAMCFLHEQDDAFPALEWVVLANDSMYWPAATRTHLHALLDEAAPWACLTESFVGRYHAQSYFLCLSGTVALSEACRTFWRGYLPHEHRRHVIRRGEIGLSQCLMQAFGKPFCLFAGGRLAEAIVGRLDPEAAATVVAEVIIPSVPLWQDGGEMADRLISHVQAEVMPRGHAQRNSPGNIVRLEMARRAADIALHQNPTHSLVRSLHDLFGAPVKRDIAFRRTQPIGATSALLRGFSPAERREIERDLRERGLPGDLPLTERLLIHTGRR
ncbi:hypothetical protein [Roseococcus microcysteis]|uniref:hypothetical protein n=1 Tax=Roseococcus microcysteis TaxID=2771361 RepID=UPI00168A9EED|nr:hypothetical protein [Roseococcus microcysteis]